MDSFNESPYNAAGNPGHPGVRGLPYGEEARMALNEDDRESEGPLIADNVQGGVSRIDNPGTGTLPPSQQGTENKAQPQGVSATNNYGLGAIPNNQTYRNPLPDQLQPQNTPPDQETVSESTQVETETEDEDDKLFSDDK